jgi:hypothetical protein
MKYIDTLYWQFRLYLFIYLFILFLNLTHNLFLETSDITVMEQMIANLEPLLYTYKVDIGFYGHNHVS